MDQFDHIVTHHKELSILVVDFTSTSAPMLATLRNIRSYVSWIHQLSKEVAEINDSIRSDDNQYYDPSDDWSLPIFQWSTRLLYDLDNFVESCSEYLCREGNRVEDIDLTSDNLKDFYSEHWYLSSLDELRSALSKYVEQLTEML